MVNTMKEYRLIPTEDGTPTLFSEKFQEACHSLNGARVETRMHYLEGTKLKDKFLSNNHLTILEVGFGTGLGALMTKELVDEHHKKCTFLSLEIDEELVTHFFLNTALPFQKLCVSSLTLYQHMTESFQLIVLIGNARQTLSNYLSKSPQTFDAIYQDAFSPKRNPVLWTKEWFNLLKEYSKPDVILSTYSSSNSIRKSLLEAGWLLQKGDGFGAKRTSTRATLQGATDPDIIFQIKHSPAQTILDSQLAKELFL
jgi:tRNA U34 5-methylaminomethyl-2-thiouridine-forming methyltransferase MnmC